MAALQDYINSFLNVAIPFAPHHIGNQGINDYGWTENVQGLVAPNAPLTQQGGSNLFGAGSVTSPSSPTGQLDTGATSTGFIGPTLPAGTPTGGTGGTGSTGTTTGTGSYDSLKNDISSGWDTYINSLNNQLAGLEGQRSAQEGIANSQYQQGVNNLGLQQSQGLADLGLQRTQAQTNQAKTLRDIASNLRNSFMAGNIFLGTKGAGDSSAANQYSYGLTKLGTQQRSDVMGQTSQIMDQINARETNIKNIFNTEVNNLAAQRDQAIQGVAQWYYNAQNQLKNMQSQGQFGKSQDLANVSKTILNQALGQLNQIQTGYAQGTDRLNNWASNLTQQVQAAKSNIAGQAAYNPALPQAQPITGTPTVDSAGNYIVPTGYGASSLQDLLKNKSIFGNTPIYGAAGTQTYGLTGQ